MNINLFPTIIYSCMLGVVLIALLDTLNKPRQRQNFYLAGLFGLLLLHILGELFIYSGAYQYAPGLAGMNFPARLLLGPALYFYACAAMSPDRQLSRRAILFALSGPVLVLVAMLPFIFGLSSQEKLALADPATRNPEHWKIAIFICTTAMLIFMLFTSAYLLAALRLHQQHRRQLMERFSAIEQRSLDWFRPVLILWGFAWLFFGVEYILNFMGWRWFGSGVVLPLLEILILVAFTQKALQQPALDDSEKVSHKPEPARVAAFK